MFVRIIINPLRHHLRICAATKMNIQLNTNSRRCLRLYTLHTTNIGQHRQHARHSASWGSYALDQDTRRLRFVQHNRRTVDPSALRAAREDPRQHWRPRGSEEHLRRDQPNHLWLRFFSRALPDLPRRL
jgi:hypothetical protein